MRRPPAIGGTAVPAARPGSLLGHRYGSHRSRREGHWTGTGQSPLGPGGFCSSLPCCSALSRCIPSATRQSPGHRTHPVPSPLPRMSGTTPRTTEFFWTRWHSVWGRLNHPRIPPATSPWVVWTSRLSVSLCSPRGSSCPWSSDANRVEEKLGLQLLVYFLRVDGGGHLRLPSSACSDRPTLSVRRSTWRSPRCRSLAMSGRWSTHRQPP